VLREVLIGRACSTRPPGLEVACAVPVALGQVGGATTRPAPP
jgi:hypothetical protein